MIDCFIGLGSNIQSPRRQLYLARKKIKSLPKTRIQEVSGLIRTKPWGRLNQPDFFNQVMMLKTSLRPLPLLNALQQIEYQLGRKRRSKWGPRCIDLDILTYGSRTINHPRLQIPHPYLYQRDFVLQPLESLKGWKVPRLETALYSCS